MSDYITMTVAAGAGAIVIDEAIVQEVAEFLVRLAVLTDDEDVYQRYMMLSVEAQLAIHHFHDRVDRLITRVDFGNEA